MRIGTPGFIPARLTEARDIRGIAQADLAELTRLKPQSICHYEQGRQSPSPEALHSLANRLSVPEHYFLKPVDSAQEAVTFHCMRPASRAGRVKAEARLSWTRELAAWLRISVDLPAPRLPALSLGNRVEFADAEPEAIESAATTARAFFVPGAGPISGMTPLLESHGCLVTRMDAADERHGACLQIFPGVPCLALADTPDAGVAAAHALGHLLLHSHAAPTQLADPDTHELLERQADHFARAFLLPARSFGKEVWSPTIDTLLSLKRTWHCPVSVMVRRCADLGIFDADQIRRAFSNMARRGWKTEEPHVREQPAEVPEMLAKSIRLVLDSGVKDAHTLLAEMARGASDLEDMAALPRGFLRDAEPVAGAAPTLRVPV